MATSDFGRDALIDARAERDRIKVAAMSSARAIGVLMEDRVRHMTALQQIARMTETGLITKGGRDVHQIARRALDSKADMSWWPDEPNAGDEENRPL